MVGFLGGGLSLLLRRPWQRCDWSKMSASDYFRRDQDQVCNGVAVVNSPQGLADNLLASF